MYFADFPVNSTCANFIPVTLSVTFTVLLPGDFLFIFMGSVLKAALSDSLAFRITCISVVVKILSCASVLEKTELLAGVAKQPEVEPEDDELELEEEEEDPPLEEELLEEDSPLLPQASVESDGQGSHESPKPSPSVFSWVGFETVGQLSTGSGTSSLSISVSQE